MVERLEHGRVAADDSFDERILSGRLLLPAPEVAEQRDLGAVVDELVDHVQDVRGAGPVGVPATDGADELAETIVVGEGEVRVPPVVGSLEEREGVGGGGRRLGPRTVQADRVALRREVEPPRRAVLAVQVDDVPESPREGGEGLRLRTGKGSVPPPGAVAALPDRPAPRGRLPEVLLVRQPVEARSQALPHVIGHIDELALQAHGAVGG